MPAIETVSRIKNLLVASCDAIKQGNRDIASNMMELALDEMEQASLEPEDIEVNLPVVSDTPEDDRIRVLEADTASMDDDEAYTSLESIVRSMIKKN